MSFRMIVRLLLLTSLVGPAGYISTVTLEAGQEHAVQGPSTPASQGVQPTPDAPASTAPPEGRTSPASGRTAPAGSSPRALVTFAKGRLSVQVQNRSLASLVEEISSASGIPLIPSEGMADHNVSIEFRDLPLDQGLQVVLKTVDAFYFYGAQGEAPATLKAVWLYPKGKGSRIMAALSDPEAGAAELEQGLSDPDPAERARAAETLIKRQGRRALETLVQVSADPDETVRYRALQQAALSGVVLPDYLAEQLAVSDSSPVVRFLALNAVASVPDADPARIRRIAESAVNDTNPIVQQRARDILLERDGTRQSPERSGSQEQQLQGQPQEQQRQ